MSQTAGNILFMYETAVGLGHQRRSSGIANALSRADFTVNVASGTFVNPEDFFDADVNLIKLPASRRHKEDGGFYFYDDTHALVHDAGHNPKAWLAERLAAIEPHISAAPIDVVMVEWWPFQRRKEFSRVVRRVQDVQFEKFGRKPLVISSVRDVLTKFSQPDGPAAVKSEMAAVNIINNAVDHLFVHADPDLITLGETFSRAALLTKPVHYTGYVVHDGIEGLPIDKREKNVLVSCGSGDHGHHLMKAAARARMHSALKNFEWIYVLGPRMEEYQRDEFMGVMAEFNSKTGCLPTQILPYMADLPVKMGQVGLSVSYAGYNSTLEVTKSRAPAVLVPKMARKDDATMTGDFDDFDKEQWRRLLRLQERGIACIAHPDQTRDPVSFASILDVAYMQGVPASSLNLDGAKTTAAIMHNVLTARNTVPPRQAVA